MSAPPFPLPTVTVTSPGDVIVLAYDLKLTPDQRAQLQQQCAAVWPHNQVVVIDRGSPRVSRLPAPYGESWLRIDRARQVAEPVDGVAVVRAAFACCKAPMTSIDAGRFETPEAIYSRRDQLTPDDPPEVGASS